MKEIEVPQVLAHRWELRSGDVLMTEGGDADKLGRGTVWNAEIPGCLHQNHIFAVRPSKKLHPHYLGFLTQTSYARAYFEATSSKTTGIASTSTSKIASFRIPLPPIQDQIRIVDFLDGETTHVEALIAKKRRLIEVLHERVTEQIKRLLFDSKSPVLPLKRSWKIIDCKHRTPSYVTDGFPVISPGDTTAGRLDLSRAHRFVDSNDFNDLTTDGRKPRRGDIIYSRNASIGIASYVDTDQEFCMGQDVCLITSTKQDQLYLTFALNTLAAEYFDMAKTGTTFSRINISQIKDLMLPTPPLDEQRYLAKMFDRLSKRGDAICSLLIRQIKLLHERRQALITTALTGELAIPERAPRRPTIRMPPEDPDSINTADDLSALRKK
jgi:type I restriction enzyme S subunit